MWTNLWVVPSGMNAVDPELATDGDNSTQMRVMGPIRSGATLAVDLRSAVKVTHVVSAARSSHAHEDDMDIADCLLFTDTRRSVRLPTAGRPASTCGARTCGRCRW
jgi:hypothetical protein